MPQPQATHQRSKQRAALNVTSSAFQDGAAIPVRCTADGENVLMNLLINGAEALGDGEGSVTIGVEACCLRSADLATCYFAENVDPGTFVRLEVRDTGCGISTEQKARMFDPFYTTKLKGRGLGLSTTLGVIRGHGGAIRVTSAPGEGSTVEVFLPST